MLVTLALRDGCLGAFGGCLQLGELDPQCGVVPRASARAVRRARSAPSTRRVYRSIPSGRTQLKPKSDSARWGESTKTLRFPWAFAATS